LSAALRQNAEIDCALTISPPASTFPCDAGYPWVASVGRQFSAMGIHGQAVVGARNAIADGTARAAWPPPN